MTQSRQHIEQLVHAATSSVQYGATPEDLANFPGMVNLVAGTDVTLTPGAGTLTISVSGGGGGGGTVTSVGMTVPSFLSVSGSPVTTSGTLAVTLSGTALPIANGGSGQTTANAALNAFLPTQTGNAGKQLQTDGTNTSWAAASSPVRPPGCVFSNGNLLLTGTLTSEIQIPYCGTITAWTIVGDAAGTASIVVSHSTYAAYDTMTTLFTATCTTSKKAQATGLSHAVTAGDILRFSGSGFALFTRVSITLTVS